MSSILLLYVSGLHMFLTCIPFTNKHLVLLVSTEKHMRNGWKLNLSLYFEIHMETRITSSVLLIMQIIISQLFSHIYFIESPNKK